MMKTKINQNRRHFLKHLALFTGGSSILSTFGNMQLIQSVLASSSEYSGLTDNKSLVCVFLFGGNDSLNTLVPYPNAEYQKYARVRQNMAIARNQLLPVSGNKYGFHPSLSGLRNLYNENKLAIAANVGNLFEPIARDAYFDYLEGNNGSLNIPPNLFSHSHQQETWQTNLAAEVGSVHPGWGGLMADLLVEANSNPDVPPAFTLSSSNLWQAGETTRPFGIRAGQGVSTFEHFDESGWPPHEFARSAAWNAILNLQRSDVLQAYTATSFLDTRRRASLLRNALQQVPSLQTPYDTENGLAKQLRSVAELIAIRESLGMKRQIFFTSAGGWDTHSSQVNSHSELLTMLNNSLFSFQRTLEELGVEDSVTTFTASEFGRTLTSNGDGTDHAFSSDYMVMGGAVDGGKVHGEPVQYSDQSQGEHWGEKLFGPEDVGSGRFIPKYSTDQYGATLAKWMGVSDSDLDNMFPNLANFSIQDLGFMT